MSKELLGELLGLCFYLLGGVSDPASLLFYGTLEEFAAGTGRSSQVEDAVRP